MPSFLFLSPPPQPQRSLWGLKAEERNGGGWSNDRENDRAEIEISILSSVPAGAPSLGRHWLLMGLDHTHEGPRPGPCQVLTFSTQDPTSCGAVGSSRKTELRGDFQW